MTRFGEMVNLVIILRYISLILTQTLTLTQVLNLFGRMQMVNLTSSYTTSWYTTVTKPAYNEEADITYGSICCLFFTIGTTGNLISFIYFKSKRRDISNVIYMIITGIDILISFTILPVGISSLSNRQPGPWFESKYGCVVWVYLWHITVSISIFLVMCLSICRTLALLRPFKRQNIKYLIISVITYSVLLLALTIRVHMYEFTYIEYVPKFLICVISAYYNATKGTDFFILLVIRSLTYIAPAVVVATSCIISTMLLKRSGVQVQQEELQRSRNRATVTILLFALLYGVCNIPLITDYILQTYMWFINDYKWYTSLYQFDTQYYYSNATQTILLAANSAANPVLYFWRMPRLKEGTLSSIRRISRLIREVTRPANNIRQVGEECENTVVQNISVTQNSLPAPTGETEL